MPSLISQFGTFPAFRRKGIPGGSDGACDAPGAGVGALEKMTLSVNVTSIPKPVTCTQVKLGFTANIVTPAIKSACNNWVNLVQFIRCCGQLCVIR
jgi:hypothetical protein